MQPPRSDIVCDALDIAYDDGVTLGCGLLKALRDRGIHVLDLTQAVSYVSADERVQADLLDTVTRLYRDSDTEEKVILNFLEKWGVPYEF